MNTSSAPVTAVTGGRVLVAEDDPAAADVVRRLITRLGHRVTTVPDGALALQSVAQLPPDLILLDVEMPHIDGIEVCRRLKNAADTCSIPVILITGLSTNEDRVRGIKAGADDFLVKPFHPEELEARVTSLLRLKRYTDELELAESVIISLALTVEERDLYTSGHCERLASYATKLGTALGLDVEDRAALFLGGYLHDLGKIATPDRILMKPSQLTADEFTVIKQHTIIGDLLCGELRSLQAVRPMVRSHHERMDGTGYPDGLRGSAVPVLAQIVGIVDAYDAMTTDRAYRSARSAESACIELERDAAEGRLRPDLVQAFVRLARKGDL